MRTFSQWNSTSWVFNSLSLWSFFFNLFVSSSLTVFPCLLPLASSFLFPLLPPLASLKSSSLTLSPCLFQQTNSQNNYKYKSLCLELSITFSSNKYKKTTNTLNKRGLPLDFPNAEGMQSSQEVASLFPLDLAVIVQIYFAWMYRWTAGGYIVCVSRSSVCLCSSLSWRGLSAAV